MFGFVYKNDKQGIVYDGEIVKVDYTMDQLEALTWWKSKPDYVTFEKKTFNIFGREKIIILPMFPKIEDKGYVNVTDKFIEYISAQARYKMITDKVLGIWQQVLKQFDVYNTGIFTGFYEKENPETGSISRIKYSGKDKAALIMLKEMLDGDIRLEPYKLSYQGNEEIIPIGTNYDANLFNKKVYIPGNYTNSLRLAMFSQNTASNRADMNLTGLLQSWQYDVILRMGRITSFVAPRRGGKTFLLAYIALKEIIKNIYTTQSSLRPISVLYLGLTKTKNYSVVQYIKSMVKQLGLGGNLMFKWKSEINSYVFRSGDDMLGSIKFISINDDDPGIGDYADLIIVDEAHKIPWAIVEGLMPIVQNEGARLVCASTLYHNVPKNWFYDLVVKGETHIVDIESEIENMYNSNETLIKKLYDGTHTFDDRKDYAAMNEQRHNKLDYVGMRYTYDDIEYIPERKKEKVKREEFEANPKKFLISFYSRFPDEGKVFDYETSLRHADTVHKSPYKYIVIGYDPALTKDNSAVVVLGYNPFSKTIALLEEHALTKTGRYEDQANEITIIKKNAEKYIYESAKKGIHSFVIIDGTQKPTAEVLSMSGFRVDCKVSYSSGDTIKTKTGISGEHIVPKKYLIEQFSEMLDARKILINKDLKHTIDEMSNFKMKLMATGYVKYEADTGSNDDEGNVINDDFVNAAMLGNYFMCNVLGLKYNMFSKETTEINPESAKMTRDELAKYHNEIITNDKKRKALEEKKIAESDYFNTFIY